MLPQPKEISWYKNWIQNIYYRLCWSPLRNSSGLSEWEKYKNLIFKLTEIKNIDLFIVHSLQFLPLALQLKKRMKGAVIFDAHDYHPLQQNKLWYWKPVVFPLLNKFHKCYLPKIDCMITVSETLSMKYYKEYGIKPEVVRNIPFYYPAEFKKTDAGSIKMIYHGYTERYRKLENLIELMRYLNPRYSLDLMLLNIDPPYMNFLEKISKAISTRINFKKPVKFVEVIPTLANYDIGIYLLGNRDFNLDTCLPSKFFQSIMAGNAVVSGVSPEMGKIIKQYNCGIYIDNINYRQTAYRLNSLTAEEIDRMKQNSLLAAKELNAENEMQKFMDIVKRLCG
jgi:glycosyltransferase involved in cell wall biosynthesis